MCPFLFYFFFCKDCVVSPRIVYSHSVLEKQKQKNTQLRKSPFFERWYTLLYCRWTREMRTLAAVPRKTAGRKVTHCALRRETLNRERDHKLTNKPTGTQPSSRMQNSKLRATVVADAIERAFFSPFTIDAGSQWVRSFYALYLCVCLIAWALQLRTAPLRCSAVIGRD